MRSRYFKSLLIVAVSLLLILPLITLLIFARYESKPLRFHEAVGFVLQTITTTGYGEQTPFLSGVTTAWSGILMAFGFVVLSVWLTYLMMTWISERIQVLPPTRPPAGLKRHVIICGTGPTGRFLARHLAALKVPYLLLDDERTRLSSLKQAGLVVMEGDPAEAAVLRTAGIDQARALIATMDDPANAGVCLLARALRPELPRLSTAECAVNEPVLEAAGATRLVSAKRSLGDRLAWLARAPLTRRLDRLFPELDGLVICQVPVLPGSPLDGQSLRSTRMRERTGANVLGSWTDGHFLPFLPTDSPLRPGQVLVAAGERGALDRLHALAGSLPRPLLAPVRSALILGAGDVGLAAAQALEREGVSVRMLSQDVPEGVPGVMRGDAARLDDLYRAGVAEVDCLIVALKHDIPAVFATLIARQRNPGLRIFARARHAETVPRLYLAGADNVLSASEVAGVQLELLVLPPGTAPPSLEELATRAVPVSPALAGRTLAESRVGERSGCLVIGIRRPDGPVEVNPPAHRRLAEGEQLILYGTADRFGRFGKAFGP